MSRLTVEQLMAATAATVNQEATAPTSGSAEYNLWLQYINRGLFEWANANNWESLRRRFYPTITSSAATVLLPLDFKSIARAPKLYDGTREAGIEIPEALPEQVNMYSLRDKYYTQTGDMSTGYALVFNSLNLSSGASLEIEYFSMPTSLASPGQVPLVQDSQFLVDRTVAYIFEARSDARFQSEESKARERLLAMVEAADMAKFNSYSNPNPVSTSLARTGFRLGRD